MELYVVHFLNKGTFGYKENYASLCMVLISTKIVVCYGVFECHLDGLQ
jgi:hypothetical protein